MRQSATLLAILAVLCAGCEGTFGQRWDIGRSEFRLCQSGASGCEALTIKAIEAYAAKEGLVCDQTDELPIECYRQPIRIWADADPLGIVVCYNAWGGQFEKAKFVKRIAALELELKSRISDVSNSAADAGCPVPPSFRRKNA